MIVFVLHADSADVPIHYLTPLRGTVASLHHCVRGQLRSFGGLRWDG